MDDQKQQVLYKPRDGIKIVIPSSAVDLMHDSIGKINMDVQVLPSGPFIPPPNCQLISHFIQIQFSHKFLKPIEIHLEHCAELSEGDSKDLKFITCQSAEPSSLHEFEFIDGAHTTFPVGSNYGVIHISKSSILSMICKRDDLSKNFRYLWMVYYKEIETNTWELHIVVTKDLRPFKQVHLGCCRHY